MFWVFICTVNLTVSSCHVTYAFQSESTVYSCVNVKELLAGSRGKMWSLRYWNWTPTQNHLARKETVNHLAKLTKWLSCVLNIYLHGQCDCMFLSCDVAFQRESALISCVNVKELLARRRRHIWSLSYSNGIPNHNHLVRKRTRNHLAKLAWKVSVFFFEKLMSFKKLVLFLKK